MIVFRVIDLETGGFDPTDDILEFGWTDVCYWSDEPGRPCQIQPAKSILYRNTKPIPPEAKAVHHITEEMVAHEMPATPDHLRMMCRIGAPNILVAHHAAFEQKMLGNAIEGDVWICTMKVAARLLLDAPSTSLQVLRYFLGLEVDPEAASPPHRAGPDAHVTAKLLGCLLALATIEEMIRWTNEPRWRTGPTFGEHKGKKWGEIPFKYLTWMASQPFEDKPEFPFWAKAELTRRAEAHA